MKMFSEKGYFVGKPSLKGLLTLGGKCEVPGAVSPNTELPLTQYAKLELSKDYLWINNWRSNEVHLLYSFKCAIHEGSFSYQYTNNKINIIEYKKGNNDYSGFPYDGYPVVFSERRFDLRQVGKDEQNIIIELNNSEDITDLIYDNQDANRLSVPTHQFGGQPYFLCGTPDIIKCPICSEEMEILSSLGNESYSENEGFFGNEFVQLLYWICVKCHVLSVENYAD